MLASTMWFPTNKPAGFERLQGTNTIEYNTTVVTPQDFPPTPSRVRDGSKGYGGHSVGETPGPIPNPEAKTHSADGTAPGRVWESRSPPEQLLMVEAPTTRLGPPTLNKQNQSRVGPSGHPPWRPLAGRCRPPSSVSVNQPRTGHVSFLDPACQAPTPLN